MSAYIRELKQGDHIILSISANGKRWSASDFENLLKNGENAKEEIAEMVYHRFYGRYIKPFTEHDGASFSAMASCCLLIEALVSFRNGWEQTRDQNGDEFFNGFFKNHPDPEFKALAGHKFYSKVRCGILHQGETTGGIALGESKLVFDSKTSVIDSKKFLNGIERALGEYKKELLRKKWDDEIWDNLRRKMRSVLRNCK